MKMKHILFMVAMLTCSFFPSSYLWAIPLGGPPFGGMPANGAAPFGSNANEQDDMLNKLMEEINAAIPEDQRENFWKEVDQETQRLQEAVLHMGDDEKRAYLFNQMNSAIEEAEALPEQPKKEEKKEEKPKSQPLPVKEVVETSDILKSITTSINVFLNKAAAFPNFERKVDRWVKQNLLSDWDAHQTWEQFKNEILSFNSLLQRFQEKDPKIGLKHIDALAKNEQAVQSLKQLEMRLAREVPTIDVSVFSITSMSKKTKNAIAHTMNALTEALYKIKLKDSLQKIIEEFDPAAKKLREAEEKIAKDALNKTHRAPFTVPVKVAGKAEQRDNNFSLPSFDDAGMGFYGGGYDGGGYNDYGGYNDAVSEKVSKKGSGSGGSGGGGGGGGGSGKGDSSGGGKGGSGAAAGEAKTDDKKNPATGKITAITNPDVKEHVDAFKKDYSDATKDLIKVKDKL